MKSENGSHDLAPKDSGTKDCGAEAIDFGTGKASSFPKDFSDGRPDSEACYPEAASFNKGGDPAGLAMRISAKDNGGSKASGSSGGM